MSLQGKTLFITGASRGIGLAIGLRAARDGANVVIAAKPTEANPKLSGTSHRAAAEIAAAGGRALAVQCDIRDEASVLAAVAKAVERFGAIDILVNNASAISLTPTTATPMKRFDLMFGVNVRGTYLCTQACLSHLVASAAAGRGAHVLNMGPPLSMKPHWFQNHTAYTMAKYGMSMCTLGMSAEFADHGIAVNSLWPRTTIATAAVEVFFPQALAGSRKPAIVAEAAHAIVVRDSRSVTGHFFIDEEVLRAQGVTDFAHFAVTPGAKLYPDIFLD